MKNVPIHVIKSTCTAIICFWAAPTTPTCCLQLSSRHQLEGSGEGSLDSSREVGGWIGGKLVSVGAVWVQGGVGQTHLQAHAEDWLLSQEETQVVLDTLAEAAGEVLSQIAQQQST
jgi:hypothetical protein